MMKLLLSSRKLIREIARQDSEVGYIQEKKNFCVHLWNIEYVTLSGEVKSVELHVDELASSAYVARTTDDNIFIGISKDELARPNLLGILAHEIGHIEAGHFNTPADMNLDRNNRKLQHYLDAYKQDASDLNAIKYQTAVIIGLIRGGVFIGELEADMIAIKYAGIESIVAVHSKSLSSSNPAVRIEAVNRISRLSKLKSIDTLLSLNLISVNTKESK